MIQEVFLCVTSVHRRTNSQSCVYEAVIDQLQRRNTVVRFNIAIGFVLLCVRDLCVAVGVSEPGSSGSVVSDYGLDDRAIEVRSPAEAKEFFL
jgi:hypothetical protein